MSYLLHNPVYNALRSGDEALCFGTDNVKYFDEAVSPFVGFDENYTNGFDDLHDLLPAGRKILYAIPSPVPPPPGWQVQHDIKGLQFVYEGVKDIKNEFADVQPLKEKHIPEMVQLAALTKPGPFGTGTIKFGSYHGIFNNDKLVAMTGQRLHVQNYTEISAVCTHPDHLGKGYAYTLLQHQLQLILQQGQHPFLHVREDNDRAIALYKRLGFTICRPMNFYFMKRL
ncbi:GNAT family N-acetyltransferase [Ferruginibacter sp. SUN106]|uniref:GNAT family N-acetyltransferase n=1 Tax=Ferruginibacter sp. SUN106 TaxID=2978348 RepID=UPI003D35AA90